MYYSLISSRGPEASGAYLTAAQNRPFAQSPAVNAYIGDPESDISQL